MKHYLKTVIFGIIILSILSGCAVETETSVETNIEGIQIINWVDNTYHDDGFERDMLEKFQKDNPKIEIKKVFHVGDKVKDYEAAVANKSAPDMIIVSYPMLSRFANKNYIEPLTDYLNEWDEIDNYNPNILKHCMVGDEIYGIPGDCYFMGLVYNKKLFEEAGIPEPPKNWKELVEYAKKLTVPQKQQIGFGLLTGEDLDWWFEYFVWQAGGDLTKEGEDGSIICTFTDDAVLQAAEFYRTLKNERVIDPDLNITYSDIQKKFAEGKIAMTFGTIGDIGVYTGRGMNKDDIGYSEFPIGPAGKNPSQFGGNVFCINATSEQEVKDATFEYMSFLRSRDYLHAKYKESMEYDVANVYLSVHSDVNSSNIEIDPQIKSILEKANNNSRMEYYGKGVVSEYINEALKNILTDDNIDIYQQLEIAEQKAVKNLK